MVLEKVENCPSTFLKWKNISKQCSNAEHYHCVLDENSNFVDGCIKPIWIEPEFCPVYNTIALKLDSQKCKEAECPTSTFRSFQIYQYPECLSHETPGVVTTPASDTYSSTTTTSTMTGSSSSLVSRILPSVLVPLVVLLFIVLIAIAVMYFKRKKNNNRGLPWFSAQRRTDNENVEGENLLDTEVASAQTREQKREAFLNSMNATTEELYEDSEKIRTFLDILRTQHTIAFIGERGSGKKTIARQLALKLEAEENELQYKVLHYCQPFDLTIPKHPTIIIIPELFKTWYTYNHVKDIMKWLASIYFLPKDTRCYVIATFLKCTWYSFEEICSENYDEIFPRRFDIQTLNFTENIVSYIAGINYEKLNKTSSGHIGKPLQALFYRKIPVCEESKFWKDPISPIMSDFKDMAFSADETRKFDYRLLVYIMLHNGCIEKEKLLKDPKHAVFDGVSCDFGDKKRFLQSRIDKLLRTYLVCSIDGKHYRIIHDVIVRCLFIFAFKSDYFGLVCNECDANLLVDCIRVKTQSEKIFHSGKLQVDYAALNVGIPSEMFKDIAEMFWKRRDMVQISRIAKFFEEKEFQKAWYTRKTEMKSVKEDGRERGSVKDVETVMRKVKEVESGMRIAKKGETEMGNVKEGGTEMIIAKEGEEQQR